MSDDVSMALCKRRLLILWLGLGGASLLLLLVRTLVGAYSPDESAVWGWFLPNIMPTLSLMIGVIVMDDKRRQKRAGDGATDDAMASKFLFQLSYGLSFIYLAIMLAIILYEALSDAAPGIGTLTRQTGYLMGPFQGVIAAALGAFFTRGA